ncbi:MAG: DNA methyltransferase [Gluconobacter oxydans]|uniref:DNA methyltransferase n=1 Tax=Gluconobacter oxydans TaxID=442 RepID=UPI0039E98248
MTSSFQLSFEEPLSFASEERTDLTAPSAYSGLYGFHKYWGKKPVEPLRALISVLSDAGDLVADPFLGAGAITREAAALKRRFLGSDINPVALRLASFNMNPSSTVAYKSALQHLSDTVRNTILESYDVEGLGLTSHLLWEEGVISSVWQRPVSGVRRRLERSATNADYKLSAFYEGYEPQILRDLVIFKNSRINANTDLDWKTLFSGRALRNIEILIKAIRRLPSDVREAFELTLTASIGQMSRMVFAITSRGKTTGTTTGKVEVGSWVLGFWRPKQHFEINVWNCFEARASKLVRALPEIPVPITVGKTIGSVLGDQAAVYLNNQGALSLLREVPESSIQLVITDPPHGDRIPYLELSEIWNAVLDETPCLSDEIVVSNAAARQMTMNEYNVRLTEALQTTALKVKDGGFVVLLFNSRHQKEWQALKALESAEGISLVGALPLNYSARSVVQDTRKGAMKTDFIIIYAKGKPCSERVRKLAMVTGWISQLPSCTKIKNTR